MTCSPSDEYYWLHRALDGTGVWNLGQLSKADCRLLDQAVRAGQLEKHRARFMHISPLKTVWCRPGHEPQEVLAAMWRAEHGKAA